MSLHSDILVVGAGPAGLSFAAEQFIRFHMIRHCHLCTSMYCQFRKIFL